MAAGKTKLFRRTIDKNLETENGTTVLDVPEELRKFENGYRKPEQSVIITCKEWELMEL